jgi:hypothetical protein
LELVELVINVQAQLELIQFLVQLHQLVVVEVVVMMTLKQV